MAAQKNLPYLLEIFQALTQQTEPDRRYELHLFGDGTERAQLEQKCRGARAEMWFYGETPRSEIAFAIDSCDLFLNTSLTEGQCLVALEVLKSRGRPLVATPVGALPEVLGQSELRPTQPHSAIPSGLRKQFASCGRNRGWRNHTAIDRGRLQEPV